MSLHYIRFRPQFIVIMLVVALIPMLAQSRNGRLILFSLFSASQASSAPPPATEPPGGGVARTEKRQIDSLGDSERADLHSALSRWRDLTKAERQLDEGVKRNLPQYTEADLQAIQDGIDWYQMDYAGMKGVLDSTFGGYSISDSTAVTYSELGWLKLTATEQKIIQSVFLITP